MTYVEPHYIFPIGAQYIDYRITTTSPTASLKRSPGGNSYWFQMVLAVDESGGGGEGSNAVRAGDEAIRNRSVAPTMNASSFEQRPTAFPYLAKILSCLKNRVFLDNF